MSEASANSHPIVSSKLLYIAAACCVAASLLNIGVILDWDVESGWWFRAFQDLMGGLGVAFGILIMRRVWVKGYGLGRASIALYVVAALFALQPVVFVVDRPRHHRDPAFLEAANVLQSESVEAGREDRGPTGLDEPVVVGGLADQNRPRDLGIRLVYRK